MTTVTLTGHLAWDAELRVGATGQHWLVLGLVIEDHPHLSAECGYAAGDYADVMCYRGLAEDVAGLYAGTTVEIDADRPRRRTWTTRDGKRRSGIQYRALAVRVIELPSMDGVVRSILAEKSVGEVLEAPASESNARRRQVITVADSRDDGQMEGCSPLWQTLIEAAEQLTAEGHPSFTRAELLRRATRIDPDHTDPSWGPILQGMTFGATGGPPSAGGIQFRRVRRGLYQLLPESERVSRASVTPRKGSRPRKRDSSASLSRRLCELEEGFDGFVSLYDDEVPFRRSQQYRLHREAIDVRRSLTLDAALHDPHFLDALYGTLRAWGIGVRASRLLPPDRFAAALLREEELLQSLSAQLHEDLADPSSMAAELWALIDRIGVVENDARLVAGTKTLHHLLPDLVPPMDRRWTGEFFGWSVARAQYQQEAIFLEAYVALATVARATKPSRLVGEGWRTSSSKVVDNAVVGYCIAASTDTESSGSGVGGNGPSGRR